MNFVDPPTIHKMWDASYAMGGPIKRDRLWFYGTLRTRGVQQAVPNLFANANQGSANAWNYEPNTIKVQTPIRRRSGRFV